MNRFIALNPHFSHVLNEFPNLQKNDLINLVTANIEEWKDKPSLNLIKEISKFNESDFIQVLSSIGVISKKTIVYSVAKTEVSSDSNWECSVCTFSMSSKSTRCDMCGMPKDDSSVNEYASASTSASTSAFAYAAGGSASLATDKFSADNTDNWEIYTGKKKNFIITDTYINEIAIGGGATINTTGLNDYSDTSSVLSNGSGTATAATGAGGGSNTIQNHPMTLKFKHTPIAQKLYVKGWTESNAPFPNNIENDLLEHFNNAICRARETEHTNYVIGIQPLPKPNSVFLVFANNAIATAAMQLNLKVYWKNSYLEVKRPQGYINDDDSIIGPLTMNVVIEKPNSKLAPIMSNADRKEIERKEMQKKLDKKKIITASGAAAGTAAGAAAAGLGKAIGLPPLAPKKKIVPVTPTLNAQEQTLVDSIKSKLKKSSLNCIELLCCVDKRDKCFKFDDLLDVCMVLNDHKVFFASIKNNKLLIKTSAEDKKAYNIENHTPVIKQHVEDFCDLLRLVKFPMFAFA
jgi:hypothetical protein